MTAQPRHSFMTVEEYLELDRKSRETRYEYIDGHIRLLAGGTANHSTIGVNVLVALHSALDSSPCRVYTSDMRVAVCETRYFYPDVTVSCDERDRGVIDIIRFPRLVVEVLSPSTEGYDRGEKFACYRACPTIQEYMLINTAYPSVELFRRERSPLWAFYAFEFDDEVQLDSIGVRFPVTALYKNVSFLEEDQ